MKQHLVNDGFDHYDRKPRSIYLLNKTTFTSKELAMRHIKDSYIEEYDLTTETDGVIVLRIYSAMVAFGILFFYLFRCYRYLKNYRLRLRNGSVALNGQQHIPSPIYSSPPPAYAFDGQQHISSPIYPSAPPAYV